MKKIISILTAFALSLTLMLPINVSAESTNATLTGPDAIYAGDTIVVSFNVSGSDIYGASGKLSYDSSQVSLEKTQAQVQYPWLVEFYGNTFVAYDNGLENPINGEVTLFTATFQVKDVEAGTTIDISFTDVRVTDGGADAKLGTITYSNTVVATDSATIGDGTVIAETAAVEGVKSVFVATNVAEADVPAGASIKAVFSFTLADGTPVEGEKLITAAYTSITLGEEIITAANINGADAADYVTGILFVNVPESVNAKDIVVNFYVAE